MASEREVALGAVIQEAPDQGENLIGALSEAEKTKRLELHHAHEMNLKRAELGWFGRVFGGESHAAIVIAFIVVILGFLTSIGLWTLAFWAGRSES